MKINNRTRRNGAIRRGAPIPNAKNPNIARLVNTGKQLTVRSNMNAYMARLRQLTENERRNVLTQVKGSYVNQGKGNVWTKVSEAYGRAFNRSGGRNTRKNRKN